MKDLKFDEIISKNKKIKEQLSGTPKYGISILSNITVAPLKEIMEYSLRLENINADVQFGNYDNIVHDSITFKKSNLVIVFWELSNVIEGFHYKANCMNKDEIDQIVEKIKSEIVFIFSELHNTSLVLFNKFSSAVFNSIRLEETQFDKICSDLNDFLIENAPRNIKIIDIDRILYSIAVENSVDFRYYYSSKALYSLDFFKSYSNFIKPIVISANGRSKKALIFDCDNTLWKGIIGEDGFEGIECSEKTKTGSIFQEVQYTALELNKKGVIIGLCSKNNPDDVIDILKNHPDMVLKEQNITVMKLNWNDKVSNLREIAQELNIGLDSLVFVDDSDFEINYITQNLPEITVVQVPSKLSDYPKIMRELTVLFFNISSSVEDLTKIEMYKQQFQREDEIKKFDTIEEYLKSLNLKIKIFLNNESQISRIAQLTQKTNQFNLTTKRYTESDIKKMMGNKNNLLFSFSVKDRFGDYGLTGLFIVSIDQNDLRFANIDTFLMSCRIIGRNIELSMFNYLIDYLKKLDIQLLHTQYLKTRKNEQVENLYEKLGCELVKKTENEKLYRLKINEYILKRIDYIKIEQNEV
jgi:FkbH-like protein